MYIISQILNFETTNLIVNAILCKIEKIIKDFLNSMITNFSTNKYISNMLQLQKNVNNLIRESIIEFIKIIDNEYMKSDKRKKDYYINKKNIDRTIITIFGEVTYSRTMYINKKTNEYYFFVDEVLGIEKYKSYDQIIRGITINDSINTNPNNASEYSLFNKLNILDYVSNSNKNNIPRQTIYRWIQELHIKKISYEPINNEKTLYVMADEKWIHQQEKNMQKLTNEKKKKYIMSKCFVIFTGIKRKKKRSKLLGRHVFITASKTPWKDLMDEIYKIYDFEKVETINLLSDAGNWILAGKSELKLYTNNKVVVNTCEFHVKQKINRSTTDRDLREKLSKSIYELEDKELFKKIMDEIIESKDKQSRKDTIKGYRDYIIKHWKGIIAMKYSDIKSSMEGHISHCVASKFGSRPKGYSKNRIEKYLKLQEAFINEINILDYYLKIYNAENDYIYNEKEVDFSLFDKSSTSNLPTVTSVSPISVILNKIAFSK